VLYLLLESNYWCTVNSHCFALIYCFSCTYVQLYHYIDAAGQFSWINFISESYKNISEHWVRFSYI
jgi:hypothetical protein